MSLVKQFQNGIGPTFVLDLQTRELQGAVALYKGLKLWKLPQFSLAHRELCERIQLAVIFKFCLMATRIAGFSYFFKREFLQIIT